MNIHSYDTTDENSDSLFNDFLNNSSSISYVATGTGGIGLELLNKENQTYNILSTNNENVVCSKVFIKLIPISNVNPNKKIIAYTHSSRSAYTSLSVYSSSSTQFIKEVNIQNIIYKKSNFGLEAVCPPIINAQIHDNNNAKEFIDLVIEKTDNNRYSIKTGLLSMFKEKLDKDSDIQLGVIAMGFTENYISLHKAIRTNPERKDLFLKLAVYELLRLYDLGYLHGDFSEDNILINPDYIYTGKNNKRDKGRALLIDFGASFPVPPRNNGDDLSIKNKIDIMLDTPVPSMGNIIPRTYRKPNNWSWLERFSISYAFDDMSELIDIINSYNIIMISMVEDKYPDLYNDIIHYNNDLDYIYIGGGTQQAYISPLLTTDKNSNHDIKQYKSLKNKNSELEKMFNPNHFNIQEVGKRYLHTLQMGRDSQIQLQYREQKMKKGGKKHKKTRHKKITKKRKLKKKRKTRSKRQRGGEPTEEEYDLWYGAERGYSDIVRKALEEGANVNAQDGHYGKTALRKASENGHPEVVKLLLEQPGIRLNEIYYQDGDKTSLIVASENGHSKVVELLLEHPQINVNVKDHMGRTALFKASENDQTEVIELLLEHPEIDVNVASDSMDYDYRGDTALIKASNYGFPEVVELLLEHPEINVNARSGYEGNTALYWSSSFGYPEIVELLLKHPQIDVNAKSSNKTALIRAIERGHKEIVKLLMRQGATIPEDISNRNRQKLLNILREMDKQNVAVIQAAARSGKTTMPEAGQQFFSWTPGQGPGPGGFLGGKRKTRRKKS